jgi:hypothetical protein
MTLSPRQTVKAGVPSTYPTTAASALLSVFFITVRVFNVHGTEGPYASSVRNTFSTNDAITQNKFCRNDAVTQNKFCRDDSVTRRKKKN